MRSVSAGIAAVLLTLSADAAPRPSPPLQCLDERGHISPDASRPLRLDGTVTRPRLVQKVNPFLPQGRQRVQGVILIESIVDRRGRVCAARLLKGQGPLAKSALDSLKRWQFEPARKNGRPVPVFFYLTVNICLQ